MSGPRLLNGHTSVRVKSSDGVTVLPCGCAYSEREWLQMCDAEWKEWHARHVAALSGRDARSTNPGQESSDGN